MQTVETTALILAKKKKETTAFYSSLGGIPEDAFSSSVKLSEN